MSPEVWLALTCICFPLLWIMFRIGVFRRTYIKNLENKAVLITGSTGDFGSQLAKRLDALGITVYAGARSPDGAAATRLKEACSSRLQLLKLDVTRDDHVAEAVETVKATLGDKKREVICDVELVVRGMPESILYLCTAGYTFAPSVCVLVAITELWAVVNNAAISFYGGFEWIPMEKVKAIMDTNVLGTMRITTAFLPLLKESRGRVVMISSLAGQHRLPGIAAYSTTKSALIGFAEAIRRELKSWSISVHLICPYLYSTNIANPETILKEMEINWEIGNDSKSSYPSTYLTYFKKRLKFISLLGKSKESIREVIDGMEDAVIGVRPKALYYPGFEAKTFHYTVSLFPACFDYILSLLDPPVREGERNRVLDFLYSKLYRQ